ncbi:hypothetical protein GJJ64_06535 [Pedobacter sp. HX-22-1]|uniref:Phosphodiester glycosidase domain-containing protein n=2 Tax=Pedobacter puniceum TaxID=2666136 RepID=A0A7K0FLI1_9SPHI|nr:hypothetical protein [Pedobacter puniceum]
MNMKKLLIGVLCLLSSLNGQSQSVVINRVFKGTEGEGTTTRGRYDAIELLVVEDHVDMRNWIIKDYANAVVTGLSGDAGGKFRFKDVALWKDLRSGTTIVLRQPGATFTANPSPDPNYVEDIDASDFTIDINIRNTNYLRTLASPSDINASSYIDRTFMLGDLKEVVLLRWDDGFGEGMDAANPVHAFAYGDLSSSSHYNGITSPKLHTLSTPAKGAYLYAKSDNKSVTDFATVTGISKDKAPPVYVEPSVNTESLAQKIKDNTNLVASITSESIVNNYPGVKEAYISYVNPAQNNIALYILEIDLIDPKLSIEVGTPNDAAIASGTQRVMNMIPYKNANSFEKQVIGAINGDYYELATGIPSGPVIKDGIRIKETINSTHNFFAQLDNKTYAIGPKLEYDRLKLKIQEGLGGKYILVQNGVVVSGVTDNTVSPRTSIGLINNKRVIMLVVDGRQSHSIGYTLQELAQVMKALGVTDAINLDGGGSSTFIVRASNGTYQRKNLPSDGSERAVSNALFLMRKTD